MANRARSPTPKMRRVSRGAPSGVTSPLPRAASPASARSASPSIATAAAAAAATPLPPDSSERRPNRKRTALAVALLLPNVISYARALLLLFSFSIANERPVAAAALYVLAMSLDALDGYAARRLGQETAYGAALDVIVDNLGRSMMWAAAVPGAWGAVIPCIEWATFAATHASGAAGWRPGGAFDRPPRLVSAVMRNHFRSVIGGWAIAGLHFFPLSLWLKRVSALPSLSPAPPLLAAAAALNQLSARLESLPWGGAAALKSVAVALAAWGASAAEGVAVRLGLPPGVHPVLGFDGLSAVLGAAAAIAPVAVSMLLAGRLTALTVEVWVLGRYAKRLASLG